MRYLSSCNALFKLLPVLFFFSQTIYSQPNPNGTPLPRIKTVPNSAGAYFCYASSGIKFRPEGNNYIELGTGPTGDPYKPDIIGFAEGIYSGNVAESVLSSMKYYGYNIVRVFIPTNNTFSGHNEIGGPETTNIATLYKPVCDNIVDFLKRARKWNMYVILTVGGVPNNAFYNNYATVNAITGNSILWLSSTFLTKRVTYLSTFVNYIKNAEANGSLLSTVFAWELQNEGFCTDFDMPFSLTTDNLGNPYFVSTANGSSYNMNLPAQRQACMDDNVNYVCNQLSATIKAVDNQAMVSLSVFTYAAVGKGGPNGLWPPSGSTDESVNRYPFRPYWLLQSNLDFVDIHQYSTGSAYSTIVDLNSSEYNLFGSLLNQKPLLMGEFGAYTGIFPSNTNASFAMVNQRTAVYSQKFAGSLLWTWNSSVQTFLWNACDNNGSIAYALAPITKPTFVSGSSNAQWARFMTDQGTFSNATWISGDFNGDGKCDLLKVWLVTNRVWADVYLSTGSTFGTPQHWLLGDVSAGTSAVQFFAGNFDTYYTSSGKQLCDLAIVAHDGNYATITVLSSNGTRFVLNLSQAYHIGAWKSDRFLAGDFNGDGSCDIANVYPNSTINACADVFLVKASQLKFLTPATWLTNNGAYSTAQKWIAGDYNGDGKCDLGKVWSDGGNASASVYLANSTSTAFGAANQWMTKQNGYWDAQQWVAGDFNGDGRCDIAKVFVDNTNASADVHLANNGFLMYRWFTQQGGFWDGQKWLSGDFDGDGLCDFTNVFTQTSGKASADLHWTSINR
jgi:hypothetical protein